MERGIHGEVCVLWSFASCDGAACGIVLPTFPGISARLFQQTTHLCYTLGYTFKLRLYKYRFFRRKVTYSMHPIYLSVSVTLATSSTTLQIPGMSPQAVPRRAIISNLQQCGNCLPIKRAGSHRVEGSIVRGGNNRCRRERRVLRSAVLYFEREPCHPLERTSGIGVPKGNRMEGQWFP